MKWADTVASRARWGECAAPLFGNWEILWEKSEAGYSGECMVLARANENTFAFYEWSYGSCSGCDEWEHRDLSYAQVTQEMAKQIAFYDQKSLKAWLEKLEEHLTPGRDYYDMGGRCAAIRKALGLEPRQAVAQ